MPYHRLLAARGTVLSHISNEFGFSMLKLRCLFVSFLGILVLIYYIESTGWGHPLFARHQQVSPFQLLILYIFVGMLNLIHFKYSAIPLLSFRCYQMSTSFSIQFSPQNLETFILMETSVLETSTELVDVTLYNCTCGSAAARRGPHQKVIGFSIYGDLSRVDIVQKYLLPLKETIKTIPSIS